MEKYNIFPAKKVSIRLLFMYEMFLAIKASSIQRTKYTCSYKMLSPVVLPYLANRLIAVAS